jgi:hypothetical protein
MALTAAPKAAHAAVDDAVASHAATETLVNNLRNTIAQLPLATRSSGVQPPPPPTARPSTQTSTLPRGLPRPPRVSWMAHRLCSACSSTLARLLLLPFLTVHPRRRAPPPLLQRQFQPTQLHWRVSWPGLRPIHWQSRKPKPGRRSMFQLPLSMT